MKAVVLMAVCSIMALSSNAQNTISNILPADSVIRNPGRSFKEKTAPAGIINDKVAPRGKWTASYMYLNTAMQGNLSGVNKTSDAAIYKQYLMSPDKMMVQANIFTLSYGLSTRLTLMATGGYTYNKVIMVTNQILTCCPPGSYSMTSISSGITDTKIYALYDLAPESSNLLILGLGANIPTGTINARNRTVMGDNEQLTYPMQPGSGSVSAIPSLSYTFTKGMLSWGGVAAADVKLNNNKNYYRLGNIYTATVWVAYKFLPFLSGSIRAEGINTGTITGSDPEINVPYYILGDPTASVSNSGGTRINGYVGVSLHSDKRLKRWQLQAEAGLPAYQNMNGVQMAASTYLQAALQFQF